MHKNLASTIEKENPSNYIFEIHEKSCKCFEIEKRSDYFRTRILGAKREI